MKQQLEQVIVDIEAVAGSGAVFVSAAEVGELGLGMAASTLVDVDEPMQCEVSHA